MSMNNSIRNVVYELFRTKLHFKEQEKKYKQKCQELQSEIQSYMKKTKVDRLQIIGKRNEPSYNVTEVKPKKIIFDVEKLESKLDKELLNEILIKEYKVSDYDGLVSLLKKYKVNPKEFKKFISVTKNVDIKKLDELSELGEISYDDIKGCYEITSGTSYVKITEMKDAEN